MTTSPSSVPAPRGVPPFEPLRIRGTRQRLRRALRRGRRAPALLLALTAASLAVALTGSGPPRPVLPGTGPGHAGPSGRTPSSVGPPPLGAPAARGPVLHGSAAGARARPPAADLVSAPVRIADAETVRLLRPGDLVDVIAAPDSLLGEEGEARVVATGARVAEVPRPAGARPDGGALVVLSVPRSTAATLAGAGVTSQLALTLC
ncbi:hypothetical protein [Streptomyces sp. NPDC058872]|uniref:hypothetical protein n=1 Tax=Streptomyces sp. NPDC058872 TaxID=3346661 RepID=UPI00369F98E0